MTRVLRKLVKWFYLLLAIALILLAVMVQSGRSFSHFVSGYNQNIAHYLSQRLNAEVTLGHISADWDGLKPSLEIHNLSIKNLQQKSILEIKQARLRLDMISSLLSARLVWSNLSVQQMQLNFVQNPLGKWHLSGLPYANETAQPKEHVKLDALLDMLLLSRRIEFQASHFSFRFASDQVLNLDAPLVFLENQSDFHRLRLQVDVDEKPRSLYLLLEGRGDPRDSEGFHTQGYLQLNQFPTSEPVAAASAFLLGGVDKPRLKSQGELNATLWFSSRAEGDGLDVQGDVAIERVLVPPA